MYTQKWTSNLFNYQFGAPFIFTTHIGDLKHTS